MWAIVLIKAATSLSSRTKIAIISNMQDNILMQLEKRINLLSQGSDLRSYLSIMYNLEADIEGPTQRNASKHRHNCGHECSPQVPAVKQALLR